MSLTFPLLNRFPSVFKSRSLWRVLARAVAAQGVMLYLWAMEMKLGKCLLLCLFLFEFEGVIESRQDSSVLFSETLSSVSLPETPSSVSFSETPSSVSFSETSQYEELCAAENSCFCQGLVLLLLSSVFPFQHFFVTCYVSFHSVIVSTEPTLICLIVNWST